MKILAIEAATQHCSTALFVDGEVVGQAVEEKQGLPHAVTLMPSIKRILGGANLEVGMLDRIAVTRGPGSFTSVRISLATAYGLAQGGGVPLAGFDTLEVTAFGARDVHAGQIIAVALDARKQEVYGAAFRVFSNRPPETLVHPATWTPDRFTEALDDFETVILLGDGPGVYSAEFQPLLQKSTPPEAPTLQHPSALSLGAFASLLTERELDERPADPLYLRLPEAERNRLKQERAGMPTK